MNTENENGTTQDPPRIRIPEEYRSGLVKISEFTEESFRKLLVAIEEEPPALHYTEFSGKIARKTSTVGLSNVRDIIETLISLHGVQTNWSLEIPELVELVTQALEREEELGLTSEERDKLAKRLILLLELDSLDATSKALDVMLEQEHTLHDVRTLTDVRPVFGHDAETPPTAIMVVHTLKISYHNEGEEVKELYVALSAGEIETLRADLERANQKTESLRQMLEPTGVPYIDAG